MQARGAPSSCKSDKEVKAQADVFPFQLVIPVILLEALSNSNQELV